MVLRLPPRRIGVTVALALAGVVTAATLLRAQSGPILQPAVVSGPNVTLTWSAVAGATSYRVAVGLAPSAYLSSFNVGNVTTVTAQAPIVGTYFARVFAQSPAGEAPSAEIAFVVTSLFVPPAAPANLAVYLNGTGVVLGWDLGRGGSAAAGLLLQVGTTPGGTQFGQFPIPISTQFAVPFVNPGTYYLRLFAGNAGGFSAASNEAVLVMPAGGGCTAPPARAFTPVVFGNFVQLSWTPVPNANQHLQFFKGGVPVAASGVAPNVGRFTARHIPLGVYSGRLTTAWSCGAGSTGPEVAINVDGLPPPGPRAPNPPPGQRLGLPNMSGLINRLAAERPDLMAQSCGNHRFLFEAVRRLRAVDNRWGLNWKRGNFGDMSHDVIDYNWGSEPDEGTRQTYIIDIIGGHCGPNPGPAWFDVTGETARQGTVGIWTLLPYLDAGYPIVSDQSQP